MTEESYGVHAEEKNELQRIFMLFNKLAILASNFFEKTPTQMAREASDLALSPSMLALCRSFFGNGGVTEKELFVLEAYAAAISRSPSCYSVGTLLVNEPYIAETYGDMMRKYAALYPEYDRPCNIDKMLRLGGEAVCAGLPRQFFSTDLRVVAGKNNVSSQIERYLSGLEDVECFDGFTICRRADSLKFREKLTSSLKTAIIYSPQNEESLLDFCKKTKKLKSCKITVGEPYEIFINALYSFTGLQINTTYLPVPNDAEGLPPEYRATIAATDAFFSHKVFGDCAMLVIGRPRKIRKIIERAQKQGLYISEALQPQNLRFLNVTSPRCPALKLKSDLLKMMYDAVTETVKIPHHSPETVKNKLCGSSKLYENKDRTDAVYSLSVELTDSPAPFHRALTAAVELILSAVKDGYSMKNGLLNLSVSAVLPMSSSEKLGHSLSVILGIYRALTELGIPMETTDTEASENELRITLILRAFSKNGAEAPISIPTESLLFASFDENSLPDFKILSDFCRRECFPVIE